MRALQAAKHSQDHEEHNQDNLKYFCASHTSPFLSGCQDSYFRANGL
jgi:hypothetical protein